MKIMFIGDLHFGKKPPHSTKRSAARHQGYADFQLDTVKLSHDVDLVVQLGDVFDSHHVNNTTFVRALNALDKMDYVLGGNHDFSHNTYNRSALADLADITTAEVILEPQVRVIAYKGRSVSLGYLHFIPYQPTQELFLQCLSNLTLGDARGVPNIICLHTNMYPENFEGTEAENNLSEEMARDLYSKGFSLIVSGHEHNACEKAGVHMVGSILPFSFGEMTDKSVLIVDLSDLRNNIQKSFTWLKHKEYLELSAKEFLDLKIKDTPGFVEIVGEVMPDKVLGVAKKMRELFNESSVFSIKNSLKVIRSSSEAADESERVTEWKAYVMDALQDPRRCELFKELIK